LPEGLDGQDAAGDGVVAQDSAVGLQQRLPGQAGKLVEQAAVEALVAAVGAADAGEAFVQVAALEELADGLVEDRPPEAELASVAFGVERSEVYLNGYRVAAILRPNTCELSPEAVKLLRKGRNTLAIYLTSCRGHLHEFDFGLEVARD